MDDQRFDRFARLLGARQSRRKAISVLAGAAAVAAIPASRARAGDQVCALTCPSIVYGYADGVTCTTNANYTMPTDNGLCGADPNILCDTPLGDPLAIGDTTVSCYIPGEEESDCSFTYTVFDVSDYVITCPADISQTAEGPTAVEFPDPQTGTECTNFNPSYFDCDYESGDVFQLGTTTVTCVMNLPSGGKGQVPSCAFDITLAPAPTATPTEVPPTEEPTLEPTTVPGEPTATEVPTAVDPTSIPADPTATTAPVTELPNTGAGNSGSGTTAKVLPIAVVGAGAALLARLGLRQRETTPGE